MDDGTIIGPHEIVVAAISYINEHGPRVGYRLNTSEGRLLLGQCASSTDALQHRQSYLDLGFLSSIYPTPMNLMQLHLMVLNYSAPTLVPMNSYLTLLMHTFSNFSNKLTLLR